MQREKTAREQRMLRLQTKTARMAHRKHSKEADINGNY